MKAALARATFKFLRTARYLTDLLVWSRVFVARRTMANIRINEKLRANKGVAYQQPQIAMERSAGHFSHGFDIIFDVLFANLRKPNHLVPMRHALPAPAFAGVYLWDSAFIAIVWRYWDTDVALDILRSVLALRDGDKLQHVVTDFIRSEFTQPPLIAWALMRTDLYAALKPQEQRAFFNILKAFNAWLNQHRRLSCGLYFWLHPYESGVENSPRFSSRDERVLTDTRHLAAPDFSSYMVLQCEALSRLAEVLDESQERIIFRQQAQEIKRGIEQWLWHEGDGFYYDWDVHQRRHVRCQTIAGLIPLAAGVPTPERAMRLHRHITDVNRFASLIPFPSVALCDPAFEKDMWRGPVWVNTAFLILDGLRRYGYQEAYSEMAWRLCDGVFRVLQREHQIYEFYDPQSLHTRELQRKKGNWWKAFTLGTGPQKNFVGWTGLVNVLVIEVLFGISLTENRITIRPAFPLCAIGSCFQLTLPIVNLELHLTIGQRRQYVGELKIGAQKKQFTLCHGAAFFIDKEAA